MAQKKVLVCWRLLNKPPTSLSLLHHQQNEYQKLTSSQVINGPNINLLGTREPQIYGSITLPQIEAALTERGPKLGLEVSTFQSNHEGGIVDRIQAARDEGVDAIILNPAGFTHTSLVIRDALLGVFIPFIECHVSNVHAREPWRHHSYFQDKAQAIICGLGAYGYVAALVYWSWKFNEGPMKGI